MASSTAASAAPSSTFAAAASVPSRNSPPMTAPTVRIRVVSGRSGAMRRRIVSATPSGSGSVPPAATVLAVGEDEPQQLVGEERVAGADVVHGAHEIGLRVDARMMGDQLADGGLAQPPQRHRSRGPLQPAQHGGEIRVAARLVVAVRPQDEQRHLVQRAADELERPERRLVHPVQVVEHDDERRARGAGREERRERLEQAEAGVVAVRGRRLGDVAQRGAQLGRHRREPRRARREVLGQLRGRPGPRELAHDLRPRPHRRCAAAVPAGAPHDGRAALTGPRSHLARERRLADAGLAGQQDDLVAAAESTVQRSIQRGQLTVAADQAHRRSHGLRLHGCPSPTW